MLVLSRKLDEEIIIGEGINQVMIKVVRIEGSKVRLGLKAGKHLPIYRSELVKKNIDEVEAYETNNMEIVTTEL